MRRRKFLTASAIAVAGLAGCAGGDGGTDGESSDGDGGGSDSTPTSTPTSSGPDPEALKGTVESFYATLYGNDNMEATNGMYHPESPAPSLKESDFEPYGGLEAIGADVQSTEVIATEEVTARVHATVDYSTPVGSSTNTDYFTLRRHDGEWMINVFLPQSARSKMSEEEIKGAMMVNRTGAQ